MSGRHRPRRAIRDRDSVSANLFILLVAAGIIAAAALHWRFKSGGSRRARPGPRSTTPGLGDAGAKSEPALSALDGAGDLGGQGEIPLLDVPAAEFPPGVAERAAVGEGAAHEFAAGGDVADFASNAANAADFAADGDVAADDSAAESPAGQFRRRPVDGFDRLSQIDFWARISAAAGGPARDVGRETVLAIYHDAAAGLRRAHAIHGLKMPDKAWRSLEDEAEDSRFADLVVTLQLADRRGPVDAAEMTRFSNLVSKLSEGTGREFQFMTTTDNALAQAAHLAEFIAHFDSVFVVNISPNPGAGEARFHGDAIDRLAPRLGLERDDNRHYSRFKQVGKGRVRLYSLADRSDTGRFDFRDLESFSTRGLVFYTKPAVNRSPGAVFAEMVDTAKAFAARMHGTVGAPNAGRGALGERGGHVDHGDLSQDDVEATRRAIEQVAADMTRAGIACGGDEAARLFA